MNTGSEHKTHFDNHLSWSGWFFEGLQRCLTLWEKERRSTDRIPVVSLARLAMSESSYLVEIQDISQGGCALRIRQGHVPNPDHDVQIVFPGGTRRKCRVRWISGDVLGLAFHEPIAEFMDLIELEHLGENYFRALVRIQSKS